MLDRRKIAIGRIPETMSYKWSAKTLEEGFVPFPKKLLRCLGRVFDSENAMDHLAVVLAIADYRRPKMSRGPSTEFLAFNAGMSLELFNQRLDELVQQRLISRSGPDEAVTLELSGLLERIQALTEGT